MEKIGVGIIGASPLNPGWGVIAHIPALQALPEYELRAVSTSRRESAEAAAAAYNVNAYDNAADLISDPGVDLVVVTVKVPEHHDLIAAAITAGKMVYSEWPLGNGLDEALDLQTRAENAGVRVVVGLQGRFAPEIQYARDLIAQGYIGDVLATTLVGSAYAWGPQTDRAHAYQFERSNGATTLSVTTLHALDPLIYLLGDFERVGARLAVRRSTVTLVENGAELPVTSPDQVAISGTLQSGAVSSVFYRGGVSRGQNLHWEINGSSGDLVLSAPIGNVQVADLTLSGGRDPDTSASVLTIPSDYFMLARDVPAGVPANVGRLYAQFARDLRDGTHVVPNIATAVARHRLIAAIENASKNACSFSDAAVN